MLDLAISNKDAPFVSDLWTSQKPSEATIRRKRHRGRSVNETSSVSDETPTQPTKLARLSGLHLEDSVLLDIA